MTAEIANDLIERHGGLFKAAKAIVSDCYSDRYVGKRPTWRTVSMWISNARKNDHKILEDATQKDDINRLRELLNKANVPISQIGSITKVKLKSYGVFAKNENTQEIETKALYSTELALSPKWAEGPQFPLVQPAKPTRITYRSTPRLLRKIRVVAVISDAQIGYLRDAETHRLEPCHDEDAIDVALQLVAHAKPDEILWIGDWMDLPSLSRWTQHAEYQRTTQPAIDRAHELLAAFIAAAGRRCKKRIFVGGNHDARFERYLTEHAKEALWLKPADATPESWPVFSMPYMLHFEKLGIHFSGHYPGGEYWLAKDLVAMHAPPKRLEMRASVVHGHTHKLTQTTYAVHGFEGRANYFMYDTGCLCRLDATKNPKRLMRTITPSDRARTDWAQGISIVEFIDGKIPQHQVSQIRIEDGAAIHRGEAYRSRRKRRKAA